MRGISFKLLNSGEQILKSILEGMEFEKYYWHISEDEAYDSFNQSIFKDEYIDGKAFLESISYPDYLVIFANIKAYPPNSILDEINDYEDFLKSDCQLVVLCYDVIYFDIYSKDQSIIKIIENNAIKNKYINIELLTSENDGRTKFSI